MYRQLTFTALLSVLILLSGSLKVPSPIAGSEFQLSAPIAVLICAYFGFTRYLTAGIIASIIGMLLGLASPLNVLIAMVFRIVAGIVITAGRVTFPAVIISGPLGTAAARLVLGQFLHVNWLILLAGAVPGMIFTAVTAGILYLPTRNFLSRVPLIQNYLLQAGGLRK